METVTLKSSRIGTQHFARADNGTWYPVNRLPNGSDHDRRAVNRFAKIHWTRNSTTGLREYRGYIGYTDKGLKASALSHNCSVSFGES